MAGIVDADDKLVLLADDCSVYKLKVVMSPSSNTKKNELEYYLKAYDLCLLPTVY